MKHLVFTVSLFASLIYFSVSSLLGLSVTEDGGSTAFYKVYCAIVFVLFAFCYSKIYLKKRLTTRHIISYWILLFYIINALITGYATDTSMLVLVAFGLPAAGTAIYYAEHHNLQKMVKWIDVLLPIISISLVFSLKQLLIEIAEGKGYYSQTLSYYAAYCFVLYLFFLLFGQEYERFSFFKGDRYKFFSILMLPYLLGIMFFSGGRGALGTIAIGTGLLFYLYHKRYGINKIAVIRSFIAAVALSAIVFMFLPEETKDVFYSNFNRVFSYFDPTKDMYERTSGRDDVLKVAFSQIYQNPILGSGLFSYKDSFLLKSEVPYPHNLFIEVLLQGGITFFTIFIILLLNIFIKLYHISRLPNEELVIIFMAFSMTMLMYSGSYMQNSFFYFFVFYVFNYSFRKINEKDIVYFNNVS